jgi:hypothetical protein
MAWYIRKSLRINKLLRLNLSKSGLGFSVGVKGARVGINSQGKAYTHVGRHGLYHRKTYRRTRQKEPMTQLQEAQICYLFNERELPRTANYTDGKTGLAAFKATHGQPSQKEAALSIAGRTAYPEAISHM